MPVTRLNYFEAKPEKSAELRELLESVVDTVSGSPGCISCQLLEAQDEPNQLVVVDVRESVEAHQAAAALVPRAMLERAMALFAGPAKGVYYRMVKGGGRQGWEPSTNGREEHSTVEKNTRRSRRTLDGREEHSTHTNEGIIKIRKAGFV